MTDQDDLTPDEHEPLDAVTRAALTPERVRSATRDRLVARAAADAASRTTTVSAPGRVGQWTRGRAALAGTALALAASLVLLARSEQGRRSDRAAFEAQSTRFARAVDSLGAAVARRDAMLASLTGPGVKMMHLASAAQASPRALMFWDQATNKWTFITHSLPRLAAGRTYELWFVTTSGKLPAGTFAVSAAGDAIYEATYKLDPKTLQALAVTEEPEGGVKVPTGAVVLISSAGSQ